MSQKRFSMVLGVALIVLGGISLAASLAGPLFGGGAFWWAPWRHWPVAVALMVAGVMWLLYQSEKSKNSVKED